MHHKLAPASALQRPPYGHRKSESGFVLVAALMAVMIILAVGFFILTTTSQDYRVSYRLVGERKAFSGAESGLQQFCAMMPFAPNGPPLTNQQVDAINDPTTRYNIGMVCPDTVSRRACRSESLPQIDATAFSIENAGMVYPIYNSQVTGNDTGYNATVTLEIAVRYGPVPAGTTYE